VSEEFLAQLFQPGTLLPSHYVDRLRHRNEFHPARRLLRATRTDAVATSCTEGRRLRELSPLYDMAKEGIDRKSVAWQRE